MNRKRLSNVRDDGGYWDAGEGSHSITVLKLQTCCDLEAEPDLRRIGRGGEFSQGSSPLRFEQLCKARLGIPSHAPFGRFLPPIVLRRVGMCAQHTGADRNTADMTRRNFLALSSACAATLAMQRSGLAKQHEAERIDAAWYARSRRFASLPMGRVAYVAHGRGPAALFLHGYPLNGYQWRGALERLHPHRRCIAPDVLGLGHTEASEGQAITPEAQVAMLAALLDSLGVRRADVVANDSGGLVAQLFVARYPERVRTLLLTNCDVDENNPPQLFMPVAKLAEKGLFVDRVLAPELKDLELARSAKGLGSVYTHPEQLTEETIEAYLGPLVASPEKKQQADAYAAALGRNVLAAVREELQRWKGPARMVWATADPFFPVASAEWLDKHLPGSQGVRPVEGAKLFFPEEMPEMIAEEAQRLWNV
jgi:haloalkane dehalogenase